MPVALQDPINVTVANGVATVFPYQFLIPSEDGITVEADGVPLTTGFTVTGVGNPAGGNIIFSVAPANGSVIVRYRDLDAKRDFDWSEGGDLLASTHDANDDYVTMLVQQIVSRARQGLYVPRSEASTFAGELPAMLDRVGKHLAFDALGNPIGSSGTGADAGLRTDLAASTGGSLLGWIQAGAGAVLQTIFAKLRGDVVDLADFGVRFDGVATGNLAKFQAAITFCADNGKKLRIQPANPSATIALDMSGGASLYVLKPIVMLGDGKRFCFINFQNLVLGQVGLDVDGTVFGTFDEAEIGGFTLYSASGTGTLMRVKNASLSEFRDIGLRNAYYGILYTGTRCFSNLFERLEVIQAMASATFVMDAHTGGGQHTWRDCTFGGDTGFTVTSTTITDSLVFYNNNFEQCVTNSMYVGGTVRVLAILGGRTEGGDGLDFQFNPVAGMTLGAVIVEGVAFSASDSGGASRIQFGGAGGKVRCFVVRGNRVSHGNDNYSADFVNLNGDGESGEISHNWLDGNLNRCRPVNVRRGHVRVFNNEANDGKFADYVDETFTIAYAAAMTIDVRNGTVQEVTITDAVAHTFNAPIGDNPPTPILPVPLRVDTGIPTGSRLLLTVRNASGGAAGAATFNAIFKMTAWVQPANGFSRSIEFKYNGANWVEISRTAADVPN